MTPDPKVLRLADDDDAPLLLRVPYLSCSLEGCHGTTGNHKTLRAQERLTIGRLDDRLTCHC